MLLINLAQNQSQHNPYLSKTLLEKIEESLKHGKKSILYINKRGEYSSLICEACSHIHKCHQCDVSLNIHKYPEKMLCHICGNQENIPQKCEICQQATLKKVGVGTQQIEQVLKNIFPKNKIFRFDTDTVKNKTSKKDALSNLQKSDIIIGTKMITTGFDFKNIGLIGIILLEQELLSAQYNTEEKVVSNIKQLIGRGSRNGEKTEVIIQTFVPENQTIKNITEKNYKDFFLQTLGERKTFHYPPFTQMITLEYRNKDKTKTEKYIQKLSNSLESIKHENKIHIVIPPNSFKKHNQYHKKIILKGMQLREYLQPLKKECMTNKELSIIFEESF